MRDSTSIYVLVGVPERWNQVAVLAFQTESGSMARRVRASTRETNMNKFFGVALTIGAILTATTALSEPIQINDDEGYSRLARWETHLDQIISNNVQNRSLDVRRAWRLQKDLDAIEAHVLQSYYVSDNGIDNQTFRTYAGQLQNIGRQIGDNDWGSHNVYGDGWYGNGYGGNAYNRGGDGYGPPAPPPPGNYYREGDYERSCHSGNAAAGTIFGAIGGGLIGSAASHGNGAAVAGGVILGGLLGNTLARDVGCDDQRYAFDSYNQGLNGDVGREYDWRHSDDYGSFTPTREYRDGAYICRDFHETTYRNGQQVERDGTACRQDDGNWAFR